MDLALATLAIAALMVGLALGYLAGNRGLTRMRAERDHHLDKFRDAITELATVGERAKAVPLLQETLKQASREREHAVRELAELKAGQIERERAYESRLLELREAKEQLSLQFKEIGNALLEEAKNKLVEEAKGRFTIAGEQHEAKLKLLLSPVQDTLKRYEEGLSKVEKERVDSYAGLREAVELVRAGQSQVRDEAAKLVNALRASPKARGRWGEQTLRNVLEQAGLSPYADFQSEVSVTTEDGRLRPDVIVSLPGGRQLIIDAKCSLNGYLDACEEVDEVLRTTHLKAHATAIRTHADQLGRKSYWDQFGDAADYVVMFIPGEHFLTAALEQDDTLWQWAFDRKVLLATPTNLVAIARTVAAVWRQEKLAEEAMAIGQLGREMYERLAVAAGHLRKVGGGLNSAVENYNKFVSSFEGRVLVSARRFRDLNVDTGAKEIETAEAIDTLARDPAIDALIQSNAAE
jgi:DNA recombination protein RmuC